MRMTGAIDLHSKLNRLARITIGVNITDAAQAAARTAAPSGATLKRRLQGRRIAMIAIPLAAGAMNPLILAAVLSAGNSGAYAAARTLYNLASEGHAPMFATLSPRAQEPARALRGNGRRAVAHALGRGRRRGRRAARATALIGCCRDGVTAAGRYLSSSG